jgi:dephospho-CoA kinase
MKAKKIAVTGSLSSGKSTVCRFFKELGAYTVNADEIVHRLLAPTTEVSRQVVDLFGADILTNGSIDRSKVALKAFSDPLLLHALECLLHPLVRNEIEKEYQLWSTSYPLFVAEIPLLFETGSDRDYSVTIAVIASQEQCKQRFEKTRSHRETTYQERVNRQLSGEEKASKATYVIDNNCSLDELKATVAKLYVQLLVRE